MSTRTTFKGKLDTYRFCDNVRLLQTVESLRCVNLCVACDSRPLSWSLLQVSAVPSCAGSCAVEAVGK